MAGWELFRQLPLIMYTFHTSRASRYRAVRAPIPEQCDDSDMNGEMRGAVRGEMVRWIRARLVSALEKQHPCQRFRKLYASHPLRAMFQGCVLIFWTLLLDPWTFFVAYEFLS